jgi:Zn finger protein HypA/HybF involved in hydrogenase expression
METVPRNGGMEVKADREVSTATAPAAVQGAVPATPAGGIVLRVKELGKRLSERGRVEVVFEDGTKYSIDASRIKELYFFDGRLYVVYETENADFYKKYVSEIPVLATKLNFQIKEIIEERCRRCGSLIEWDADEPYCPKCGANFPGYDEIPVKLLERGIGFKEEIENFARALLGAEVEYVDALFRNIAGGFTPLFDLSPVYITLYTCVVKEVAIVENPVFKESHYDEWETYEHKYEGKFAVLRVNDRKAFDSWTTGFYYVLFRLKGEPKLDLLNEFVRREEERRKREEEERRRREEEVRKKREEEERRWSDPSVVAKEIISRLPEWADGAYVKQKAVWGEDADVVTYVLPAKKSRRGSGFYTSESWRTISIGIPEKFLDPFVGKVITKNGIMKVKEKKNGGKYVELEVVANG